MLRLFAFQNTTTVCHRPSSTVPSPNCVSPASFSHPDVWLPAVFLILPWSKLGSQFPPLLLSLSQLFGNVSNSSAIPLAIPLAPKPCPLCPDAEVPKGSYETQRQYHLHLKTIL